MAANPDNASLWAEADVYVNTDVTATRPTSADESFDATWGLVGLLSGEDGFTEAREEESSDHYAWGGILVKTARRNFKLTKKFSALEDNDVTRGLIWPGSPPGRIIVPRPQPVLLAFETREGGKVRRLITERYAVVTVDGDIVENESDLTKYELLATIFPTGDGGLFIEQKSEDGVEGQAMGGQSMGFPAVVPPADD